MNCIEARRKLLTAPEGKSAALDNHLKHCKACHKFSSELKHTDEVLRQALDIDVPENLANKILLRRQLKSSHKKPVMIAASLIFLVCLGAGGWLFKQNNHQIIWNDVVLQHVIDEPKALLSAAQISTSSLNHALGHFGLESTNALGEIHYLDKCDLPGGKGLHVVVESKEYGQISLILPPRSTHTGTTTAATGQGFAARMIPIGSHNIGVVIAHPDQLEAVGKWLPQVISTKAG